MIFAAVIRVFLAVDECDRGERVWPLVRPGVHREKCTVIELFSCAKVKPFRILHATASNPGAIAIVQIVGDGEAVLRELTGVHDWPIRRARLVDFDGIDQGIAVRLTEDVTQLMPHGGPRVVQRLTTRLIELGGQVTGNGELASVDPLHVYPEAADRFEALMLLALARAESPLAIDLLLDQPRRWRAFHTSGDQFSSADHERSKRLNRLIVPPIVVLAGRPNVGKSTLSNALLGRSMSIAHDMPGTTRDYVAGRIDLGGIVVDWHDTPGIRETEDPIERKAIEISRTLIQRADLLIGMRDAETDWPELPRAADVMVVNKIDRDPGNETGSQSQVAAGELIRISAQTGSGLVALVASIQAALIPADDLANPRPWLFDPRLLER